MFDPAVSGQYLDVSWFPNGSLLFSTYERTALTGADNGLAAIRFLSSTVTGAKPTILYEGINVDRPAASPSGNTLVFEAEHGAYQSNPNIDIETLELRSLTVRVLTNGRGQYMQAAWSPGGSKVAYACKTGGARDLGICVMDLGDRRSHVISHGPGSHQWPSWAPDSKRLAFFIELNVAGKLNCNIAVVNVDGSGQRLLTHHAYVGRDETPSWAPDGKHIAFQTDRLGDGLRIAVMDADGKNVRMLTR
jgi:TolB protein